MPVAASQLLAWQATRAAEGCDCEEAWLWRHCSDELFPLPAFLELNGGCQDLGDLVAVAHKSKET